MNKILFTASYIKKSTKFFKKHPEIIPQYEKILKILCVNPAHPSLLLHTLSGKLHGLSSVSITLSYRLVISFLIRDGSIVLVDIGKHDDVY